MKKTEFITVLMVAMVIITSLLLLTGAVSLKTENYHKRMLVRPEKASINIACSADGKVVYIADGARVLRSKDCGENWEVVITSHSDELK